MKHLQKTVTFLGRITIQKGPCYFAEVARFVLNRMKMFSLLWQETGNYEMKLSNVVLDME